ncbi:MAG: SDR family NAD(P)-dependent oxidoreductase [Acidimicrobiales bacterium]|nr:SDR family NAD(P)-dependent oxidoreductase [Acidimicrobiales bacterium]MCB1013668.1 SDR family NAD(P)-dependent oxidoreductase [Acidimicrobiales bacterium]
MDLQGRRVLVTGASRGIGEATARAFAAAGATVALVARDAEALAALAAELGGTAHPADLLDRETVAGLIPAVEGEAGPVDVLVNNAGMDTVGSLVDTDPAALDAIYQLNLLTPVQLCRAVLPAMLGRGRGHLVNVSSLAGVAAYPGMAAYASTKAGLTQFTEVLALDLKGLPVGTTIVQIGPIPTDMLDHVRDYAPTRDSFDRGYRLRLLVDLPREQVADAIVDAVRRDRRHVRLPRRAAAFPLLAEAPRRISDVLLTGIRHQG